MGQLSYEVIDDLQDAPARNMTIALDGVSLKEIYILLGTGHTWPYWKWNMRSKGRVSSSTMFEDCCVASLYNFESSPGGQVLANRLATKQQLFLGRFSSQTDA